MVKNSHKLGVETEPIPFSYKSGQDGREKPQKGGRARAELYPREPEGLYEYTLPGAFPVFNSVNMEQKSTQFLNVLHRRLGYVKAGSLERITNCYETNKRKYEASCRE